MPLNDRRREAAWPRSAGPDAARRRQRQNRHGLHWWAMGPNGASPILSKLPKPSPNGRRRFDWPAFLRAHSETGQTNRLNGNLDGHALIGRSKTALHSAVVRSCHSRPAPFRCRFQNARSVLRHLHISAKVLGRSAERN